MGLQASILSDPVHYVVEKFDVHVACESVYISDFTNASTGNVYIMIFSGSANFPHFSLWK